MTNPITSWGATRTDAALPPGRLVPRLEENKGLREVTRSEVAKTENQDVVKIADGAGERYGRSGCHSENPDPNFSPHE